VHPLLTRKTKQKQNNTHIPPNLIAKNNRKPQQCFENYYSQKIPKFIKFNSGKNTRTRKKDVAMFRPLKYSGVKGL